MLSVWPREQACPNSVQTATERITPVLMRESVILIRRDVTAWCDIPPDAPRPSFLFDTVVPSWLPLIDREGFPDDRRR
jgi:hypothetical protein